jgi:16S rRNA (cytidine1402-2'-O)-methyltransferase
VKSPGGLYLLPAGLSEDTPAEAVVPAAVIERIRSLDTFIVEDAKSARAWLAKCAHPRPLREISMAVLDEHTPAAQVPALLAPALDGKDLGLLSEAGLPAIADPGALLVAAAHAQGITVYPMVGPSSILLALMASGLEGQRFRFHGYLPAEASERRARITQVERASAKDRETQIFIETPYRNDAMLADLLATCRATTRLAVAADLTSPREWILVQSVAAWRAKPVTIGKRPAIFLLLA